VPQSHGATRLLGNVAASPSPFVPPDIEADIRPGSRASDRRARQRSPGGRSGQHFFVKRTRIGANFAQIIRGNPFDPWQSVVSF
jgi:hypothetical protein